MQQDPYYARHARPGPVRKRRRFGCLTRLLTLLLLLVLIAWPFVEPRMLQVEEVTLTSADLPDNFGSLRLVYLSDIHAGYFFSDAQVESLVHRVNSLHPDIILLGGDYAQDSEGAIAFFKNAPAFQSRYGVFAVPGNHDRTEPESNLQRLRAAMRGAGITPLINETASVRIGEEDIYIAGIDDMNTGWPNLSSVTSRLQQEDYVIFLSHTPEIIPEALNATDKNGRKGWYDLGLFGHTHGGQIAFLGQFMGISKVESRYEQGWLRENRIDMLVSRGVGMSLFPARFLRPPQIHLITVKPD